MARRLGAAGLVPVRFIALLIAALLALLGDAARRFAAPAAFGPIKLAIDAVLALLLGSASLAALPRLAHLAAHLAALPLLFSLIPAQLARFATL